MGDGVGGTVLVGNLEEVAAKALRWIKSQKPIKKIIDWGVTFSLWPAHLMTACCGAEFAAAAGPRFDLERLGFLPFGSPRQTNILFVEGTLTRKMAKVARISYEQMPTPKWVIAMGACAIEGGIFWDSYNIVKVYEVLPVDVFIPGCPPRPEAVAVAILKLKEKIKRSKY